MSNNLLITNGLGTHNLLVTSGLGTNDVVPIAGLHSLDERAMDVFFEAAVVDADALNPANYSINSGAIKVVSVEKITDSVFRIHTAPQARVTSYTLRTSNIHQVE